MGPEQDVERVLDSLHFAQSRNVNREKSLLDKCLGPDQIEKRALGCQPSGAADQGNTRMAKSPLICTSGN
jgi:hypothetical protein